MRELLEAAQRTDALPPVDLFPVPHYVKNHILPFDIVPDAVVAHPVPPLTDCDLGEFLTSMRISRDPLQALENLALDLVGELAEVVLEPLGGDDAELGHLARPRVDRPECLQATDLPSLVLTGGLPQDLLESLVLLLRSHL